MERCKLAYHANCWGSSAEVPLASPRYTALLPTFGDMSVPSPILQRQDMKA